MRSIALLTFLSLFLAGGFIHAEEEGPYSNPLLQHDILEKPKSRYQLGDTVFYRVKLLWQKNGLDELRLIPPTATLDNLEFLGLGQESTAVQTGDGSPAIEQILTFRFQPKEKGNARVGDIHLQWQAKEALKGPDFVLPGSSFTIRSNPSKLFLISGLSAVFLILATGFICFSRQRWKGVRQGAKEMTLEGRFLEDLRRIRTNVGVGKPSLFAGEMRRIADAYLVQKFNWNRSADSYNTLAETLNKKEAEELNAWFKRTEEIKFSGEKITENQLLELYQFLVSFIEKRQLVSVKR